VKKGNGVGHNTQDCASAGLGLPDASLFIFSLQPQAKQQACHDGGAMHAEQPSICKAAMVQSVNRGQGLGDVMHQHMQML
jgi:hypothetical protein